MASCLGWFVGFVLLTHWTVYAIRDTSSAGFFGTLLKLVAAVFFNMQPISAMWEEDAGGSTAASQSEFAPGVSFGLNWTNFLGIWYHAPNIVHRPYDSQHLTESLLGAACSTPATSFPFMQ